MTNNTMVIEDNLHNKTPPKRNSNDSDNSPNLNIINNDTNDTNTAKNNNNSTNSITNYLTNHANNNNKNQTNSTPSNPYKKSKTLSSSSTTTGTTASNTTCIYSNHSTSAEPLCDVWCELQKVEHGSMCVECPTAYQLDPEGNLLCSRASPLNL